MSTFLRYTLWSWLFVLLGLTWSVLGPALPPIRDAFDASIALSGAVFAVHSAGYFAGVFLAGPASDRRGRRIVSAVGSLGLAAGMGLAAASPGMDTLLAAMAVAGAGFAAVDVAVNAAVGDTVAGAGRRAAVMNLLHAAFPAGTLAGPVWLAFSLQWGLGWRISFGLAGAAALLSAGAIIASRHPWPVPAAPPAGAIEASREAHGGWLDLSAMVALLGDGDLRRLASIQAIYVGVEVALAGWLATFLVSRHGASESEGALATSVFWAGFLLGRPAVAYVTHRWPPARVLPWLAAAGLVLGWAAVLAPGARLAVAACALAGASISGIFPTVMALSLEGRPRERGAVTGLVIAAGALGSLIWPWLVGLVAEVVGLAGALAAAASPLLALLWLSLRLGSETSSIERQASSVEWRA